MMQYHILRALVTRSGPPYVLYPASRCMAASVPRADAAATGDGDDIEALTHCSTGSDWGRDASGDRPRFHFAHTAPLRTPAFHVVLNMWRVAKRTQPGWTSPQVVRYFQVLPDRLSRGSRAANICIAIGHKPTSLADQLLARLDTVAVDYPCRESCARK
ncbi:hypothetical protein BC834DRAFT_582401 [Gloeopeniophorella convolvens]|nr:hypothetical protein BC834DRAFT_582401 [Gloeopeniophorella convolvens]